MKSALLLFTLLNFSALNYDYDLINFNSSRQYSEEELLQTVGMTKDELKIFTCDIEERFSLFTDDQISNPNKTSLKVRSNSKKLYVYRDNNLYLNSRIYTPKRSETFLRQFLTTIKKLENTKVGKELIKKLSLFKEDFVIKKGWSHFEPNSETERKMWHINEAAFASIFDEKRPMFADKVPLKKIGTAGTIFWDPSLKAKFIEADYIKRTIKPVLVLAHEMYHAYDASRGLLDRRFVKSDELEFTEVTEYRAVYFENRLRSELNLKYRRYYSDVSDFSKPDLLNEDDSPIFLPSPCIGWL